MYVLGYSYKYNNDHYKKHVHLVGIHYAETTLKPSA